MSVWQSRPASESGDRIPCRVCGGLAYDLSDALPLPPCAHGEALCGDCLLGIDGCVQCRLEAEQEMHASDEYDPHKDPFYRPEAAATDAAYWAASKALDPAAYYRKGSERRAELERIREADREAGLRYQQWLEGRAEGEG